MIDYRALLIKYISIVGNAEGVSFMPRDLKEAQQDGLTEEEYAELLACDKESQ